jgi:NAD(P)-dependent dehydrogenase (short-subunit alcohol dehydrogenase family)
MAERAAIVTGASRGIGLAIAEVLGEEGHALTISSRRPDALSQAGESLRAKGYEVNEVPANMADEDGIKEVVASHREAYGRCDVLVNNAGMGVGAPVGDITTKFLDMQLDVDLRAIVLFYREALEMLQAAGAEHGKALVVNMSSLAGKSGQPWLSVYSAAKHGVIGWTQAMNKELAPHGIKSAALCPGFVDTDMTDFVKESGVKAEEMIQPGDIAETVRLLLRVSRYCVIPEVVFLRPGEQPL